MAFEKIILSKTGRDTINNIITFVETLIIKVEAEAREYETKENEENWIKYKCANEASDNIYAYAYGMKDLKAFGFSEYEINSLALTDNNVVNSLITRGNEKAKRFLAYLRQNYLNKYTEYNKYYRQFLGIPIDESQYIYIENLDVDALGRPKDGRSKIPIHEVTENRYIFTYEYLYIQRYIEKYIRDYPELYYLRFIEKPLTIYDVRNAKPFEIIYYKNNGNLSEIELDAFLDAYSKSRYYVMRLNWKEGFEFRYPVYPYMEQMLILKMTFETFFNKYMDNYILNNFTDKEIFDMLDSYNLQSLKKININILRTLIKYLPELLENRGSSDILIQILKVLNEESVTIKRYFLEKKYNLGLDKNTEFDVNKYYEDSVEVVFREEIFNTENNANLKIVSKDATQSKLEVLHNYHAWVKDDNLWGGDTRDFTDDSARIAVKENLRKELIQMNFSSIYTKYIVLSTVVETYDKLKENHNKLGLLIQFSQQNQNFMLEDEILFKEFVVSPMTLYAGLCWVTAFSNRDKFKHDYSLVTSGNLVFSSIMKLIRYDLLLQMKNELKELEIPVPFVNIKPKMKEYFGDIFPYDTYITGFMSDSDVETVIRSYDENSVIINEINRHMFDARSYTEFLAWKNIYDFNIVTKRFNYFFNGKDTFPEYIDIQSPMMTKYMQNIFDTGTMEDVNALLEDMYIAFNTYITKRTNNAFRPSGITETASSVSFLNDLVILFNEFVSIYSSLYKIEQEERYTDMPYNRFRLFYQYTNEENHDSEGFKWELNQILQDDYLELFNSFIVTKYREEMLDIIYEYFNYYIKLDYYLIVDELFEEFRQRHEFDLEFFPQKEYISSSQSDNFHLIEHVIENQISFEDQRQFVIDYFDIMDESSEQEEPTTLYLNYNEILSHYQHNYTDHVSLIIKFEEDYNIVSESLSQPLKYLNYEYISSDTEDTYSNTLLLSQSEISSRLSQSISDDISLIHNYKETDLSHVELRSDRISLSHTLIHSNDEDIQTSIRISHSNQDSLHDPHSYTISLRESIKELEW
jgi:hypothetical protein